MRAAFGFVTIADTTQMTMTASIAEADIADVAVGQLADVTFPALDDVATTATVTAIAPTATASNSVVTYATTITLDSIPEGLRLGQTASVTIRHCCSTSSDIVPYRPQVKALSRVVLPAPLAPNMRVTGLIPSDVRSNVCSPLN